MKTVTTYNIDLYKKIADSMGFTTEYGTTWRLTEFLSEVPTGYLRIIKDGIVVAIVEPKD